jgi:hypothetical protein
MEKRQWFLRFARLFLILVIALIAAGENPATNGLAQGGDNPNPPDRVVKLVFIHHSTGENWLRDDWGGLGGVLAENNYFVSDTNYGWGPDAIGDRTDIVNWPEWFRGPESSRYLAALFIESGQHSEYSRGLADPGGENQVILFKSCFPNSNLEGNPYDQAVTGGELTVANAKYIYNDLLETFRSRPDKLFVVITAPPLQDAEYAENARAFNLWLVNDWLAENNYPLNNVAVFDFYNVLTHPENHHRYRDGQIEHISEHGNNTLRYASARDDDHPNPEGSRKATQEFLPLLNVFYHRWQAGLSSVPPIGTPISIQATPVAATPPAVTPGTALPPRVTGESLIDDFENPASGLAWEVFWDEAVETRIACAPQAGLAYESAMALQIDYEIAAESWATCALLFESTLDWSGGQGLSFYMQAAQAGLVFDVILYGGSPGDRSSYMAGMQTTSEMVNSWEKVTVGWSEFFRAAWEENPGSAFNPAVVTGIAFGFGEQAASRGEIWIDQLILTGIGPGSVAPQPSLEPALVPPEVEEEPEEPPEEPEEGNGFSLPCISALGLGLLVAGAAGWRRLLA